MIKLYLESIKIENIKTIDELYYKFPEVKFDLDGNAIIGSGVLLTGSNFIGKTTFLQCINTALKNDIGDCLNPDKALRNGQNEGLIDITLIGSDGTRRRITHKLFKDTNTPVEHTWIYTNGRETLKSYQSGAIGKLKKIFNYHYIDPNNIVALSQSPKGRRKLMGYFLNSVPTAVRDEYMTWDTKEQAAFEIRTDRNVEKARTKTIRDNLELSPEDENKLRSLSNFKEGLANYNIKRDTKISEIIRYNQIYNKIYPKDGLIFNEDSCLSCLTFKARFYEELLESLNNSKSKINIELDTKVLEVEGLSDKFNTIITALTSDITNVTVKTYSKVLDDIKVAYRDLVALNSNSQTEVDELTTNINRLDREIKETTSIIITNNIELIKTKDLLPKVKPDTVDVDRLIAATQVEIDAVNLIVEKRTKFNTAVNEALEADVLWEDQNVLVEEARAKKQQIIKDNNIEVEGFEFDPDGITLKGYEFAERAISGAERRIAATQFTMAMNNTVMLAILEEMESLDSEQEQHIFKFAAKRGFVILSDNVIKEKVDKVVIKEIPIV